MSRRNKRQKDVQYSSQHIPDIVQQEVKKAWKQLPNFQPSTGPKSWMHDPMSLQYSLGYKDRKWSLTYDTLRRVARQLAIIGAIINTRSAQVAAFSQPYRWTKSLGFNIRHKDPDHSTTPAELDFIKELEQFILNCGRSERNQFSRVQRDDFEALLRKLVRDSLELDQVCCELVYDQAGLPYEFYAVDASTVRIATNNSYMGINSSYHNRDGFSPSMPSRFLAAFQGREYGQESNKSIDYVQVINGQIENVYSRDELAFGIRNTRTDLQTDGYGYGEIEQLITIVTSHLYAEQYNRHAFTQNSIPKGIINFKGDSFNAETLEGFRRQWLSMTTGVENAFKTPIIQSEGLEFVDMNRSNQEMEYGKWVEYLIKTTCFTENTPVSMSDGSLKYIKDVRPGDTVLTHAGLSGIVSNTQKTDFTGKLKVLTVAGRTIETTSEHPFLVASSFRKDVGSPKEFKDLQWKPAADLTIDDYLVVPKIRATNEICNRIDISKYLDPKSFHVTDNKIVCNNSNRAKAVPRYIHLTKENAFVLGLFVSEGCTGTNGVVSFCFAEHEQSYRDAVKAFAERHWLNSTAQKSEQHHTEYQRFCSKPYAQAFSKMFGHLSHNKQVPEEILAAASDVQKAFLSGLIAGDGCVDKRSTERVRVGTVSKRLSDQIEHLFLCNDIYPQRCLNGRVSDYSKNTKRPVFNIEVIGPFARKMAGWLTGPKGDLLRSFPPPSNVVRRRVYEFDNHFLVPIKNISERDFSGCVFNFEVGTHHTYQVDRLAVHNCSVYLIDPSEVAFEMHGSQHQNPMFESSNEWKIQASRDKGLKPLLRFLAKYINTNIIDKIDDHFTLEFVGLDELSENEKHEMLVEQISSYMTLNEGRRTLDLPDLPGGDVPMNPVYQKALELQTMQQGQAQQPQGQLPPSGPAAGPKYSALAGFNKQQGEE